MAFAVADIQRAGLWGPDCRAGGSRAWAGLMFQIGRDVVALRDLGGGRGQFSAVPLNLLKPGQTADYIVSGAWSKSAVEEAVKYGTIKPQDIRQKSPGGIRTIVAPTDWQLTDGAAYVHCCPNETVDGVEFTALPDTNSPIVADLSSTILSRPIDVSRYGVIYAGAQKNIGPAGLVIVIVREDLLGQVPAGTPGSSGSPARRTSPG